MPSSNFEKDKEKIELLMAQLQKVQAKESELKKELRSLIYKSEKR